MPFARDYFEARQRFRTAVAGLGWNLQSFPVLDDLTIDVGISPGSPHAPLLIVSSGVHGVEGFFGSAVQIAALEAWGRVESPREVRCVFLYALCPSGFAHIRRFNEENIDLNRNFLRPGEEYSGSPKRYANLDRELNPRRPPSHTEFFTLRALVGIARFGFTALKQAIAGGQYDFPKGMFFGGHGPSRTNAILTEHFPRWLADAPRGVLLDFHSGLGKSGEFRLLVDTPPHSKHQIERISPWFPPGIIEATDPNGTAYEVRGGFDTWCTHMASGRDFISFCAEVGTHPLFRVLGSVRAENMAHHWCPPGDPRSKRAKAELLEMFCPQSRTWRKQVLSRGMQLIDQSISGLTASS